MLPVHILIHALGTSIEAKASGMRLKRVACEHCGQEYVYQMRRKTRASAYAFLHRNKSQKQSAAYVQAHDKLRKVLDRHHDVVGCPFCGYLQRDMIKQWRRRQFQRLATILGISLGPWILLLSFAVVGVIPNLTASDVLLYFIAFAAFLAAWGLWAALRDPNQSAFRRTRQAMGQRCRAMPADEFDAMLAEDPESSQGTPITRSGR